jgi:hypothetical protein
LRNGEEAVQLATKAVELTDRRLPILLGTLAVTYAEAGQFSKADAIAFDAKAFAKLTGRKVVLNAVDKNALLNLYSSGKAVDATNAP